MLLARRNFRKNKKIYKLAVKRKHRKTLRKNFYDKEVSQEQKILFEYGKKKRKIVKKLHKRKYKGYGEVVIEGEFGIEVEDFQKYFLEIASKCIELKNARFVIDIQKCSKIWPSGVTFLCSIRQWGEIGKKFHYHTPTIDIRSNNLNKDVRSYLSFCGFDKYVEIEGKPEFPHDEEYESRIVKLEREKKTNSAKWMEKVEDIRNLVAKFTDLTEDEIDLFDNIILQETYSNVTEHGMSYKDDGWWMLCQYHKRHKFISLCMADNGIGFKKTLLNGPQSGGFSENDGEGDFIKKSLESNISGAYDADIKRGIIKGKYPVGDRRGQGLNKIRQRCKELGISFSILSHRGYLFVDKEGEIRKYGSETYRIFGGTMYNYIIPAGGKDADGKD